jgi:hypothetical protein
MALNEKESKLKKLDSKEVARLKKEGMEIREMTSKKIFIFNLYFLYSYNFGFKSCRKIKFNRYVSYFF